MKIRYAAILALSLGLFCTGLNAQHMVKDSGQDGLMKTVTYNVSSFTDVRDKKLKDVLVKMPGISGESSSGYDYFTYNGMTIEHIYVNGIDALEGNYQPVYNLKPDDVEALEITENHVTIKVMRGKQYSNTASINVILKEEAKGKWSGSVKAMGGIPGVGTADINGLNLGPKVQTTVMLKADNTGLDFSGPLHGFGDYGYATDIYNEDSYAGAEGIAGGFDYDLRKFLDVEPSLAPLASERVRFNRSSVAQVGSTYALSKDYQLNVQLTLHANRLVANSLDETTYYMGGVDHVFSSGEEAKMHQYDIQTQATLLSNTSKQFVRNQLIFNHRRIDMFKDISGNNPTIHDMDTKPIYLKDDLHIKRLVGDHILSINAMTGYNTRPQDLLMIKYDEFGYLTDDIDQSVVARSGYFDLGAKMDFNLADGLNLSLNAGGAYNARALGNYKSSFGVESDPVIDNMKIYNAFGGASLTYINDRLQASFSLPLIFGAYEWNHLSSDNAKSILCVSPKLNVKYDFTNKFSVAAKMYLNQNPLDRKRIYSGTVTRDFRESVEGYPDISKDKSNDYNLLATYRSPEHSLFVNASLTVSDYKKAFLSYMRADQNGMVSSYMESPENTGGQSYTGKFDINKGISSFKGKVGLTVAVSQENSLTVRQSQVMPYVYDALKVSPYINGRLSKWCNMIYKLSYLATGMQFEGSDRTHSKSYEQSLELIFSPWEKINFSLLGEHYYTEFTDEISKHLVLADFKAEYTLNDRWQLLLTATNILNQKTYNYTLVNSEAMSRSFTSYTIRPRNILLGFFFKF